MVRRQYLRTIFPLNNFDEWMHIELAEDIGRENLWIKTSEKQINRRHVESVSCDYVMYKNSNVRHKVVSIAFDFVTVLF